MAIIDTLNLILFLIMIVDGLMGVFLIVRGFVRRLYNMIILGMGFVGAMLSMLLVVMFGFSWNQVAWLFMLSFFTAIPFTHLTFHKNLNKPYPWIYALSALAVIIKVIFATLDQQYQHPIYEWVSIIFEIVIIFISFSWLGYAAIISYNHIKNDPIEPWIKERIRLLGIASWAMAVQGFPQILFPIFQVPMSAENPISLFIATFGLILTAIFAFGNIIAWFMPDFVKKRLNRGFSEKRFPESPLSEEEIMNKLREGS